MSFGVPPTPQTVIIKIHSVAINIIGNTRKDITTKKHNICKYSKYTILFWHILKDTTMLLKLLPLLLGFVTSIMINGMQSSINSSWNTNIPPSSIECALEQS